MNECQILEGMQELFGPKGIHWGKHNFRYRTTGGTLKYCLLGAFAEVSGKVASTPCLQAYMPITYGLIQEETTPGTVVVEFNDDPETTWSRVNRLLKKAKKEACNENE